VIVAADYPFLDLVWTMIIIVAWVIFIWMVIAILSDVFRRRDIGGFTKVLWTLFVIFLPLIGILSYLIVNGDGMGQRNAERAQAARGEFDDYVRSVADGGGAAAEIERAKGLLDTGAITQTEFDAIKAKALAS
jgi:hypothetical protein